MSDENSAYTIDCPMVTSKPVGRQCLMVVAFSLACVGFGGRFDDSFSACVLDGDQFTHTSFSL